VHSKFKNHRIDLIGNSLNGKLNVTIFKKDPIGINISVTMDELIEVLKDISVHPISGDCNKPYYRRDIEVVLGATFDKIVTEVALWAYELGEKEATHD
jgi:hypothetical protein